MTQCTPMNYKHGRRLIRKFS